MSRRKALHLIGYASGIAGADSHAGDGPVVMQQSLYLERTSDIEWDTMLYPDMTANLPLLDMIRALNVELAQRTEEMVVENQRFCVLGGDHSCAIGTWSGVHNAMHAKGDLGLIWVDAHMDSHTPETSPSGRVHGMPLAVLLGHGHSALTSILNASPKIKPQHLCLIGVRSYEAGEAELLKKLNVKIYFMEEVKQRGFAAVLSEAAAYVRKNTYAYGLTVDLDSLDPLEAPGVDVPEEDGIRVSELKEGLRQLMNDPQLIATEITEFDPTHDKDQKTEIVIADCLEIIAGKSA